MHTDETTQTKKRNKKIEIDAQGKTGHINRQTNPQPNNPTQTVKKNEIKKDTTTIL